MLQLLGSLMALYYELHVCDPQNPHVETPISSVIVFGGRTLGDNQDWTRSQGWGPYDGFNTLIKRGRDRRSRYACMKEGHVKT